MLAKREITSTCFRALRWPMSPPGPAWLHEIDLVGYDYFSHGGKGWYADLQTLSEWIPRSERHRVAVTLHGWFGLCGHYAYDRATKDLLNEWTVFPGWESVKEKFPTNVPVQVNIQDIRARLGRARKLGFRPLLYFADGTNACTDAGWRADNQRAVARRAWTGPDTMGESLMLNVVHSEVIEWYEGYLKALLRRFGDWIDGLVWDETFYVRTGDSGASECPGYGARAMMRLVKRLADIVHQHDPRIAFLTSDCIGAGEKTMDVPPYALVADGCYQDSGCEPQAWPYGLFPNYRNTLWSCNWWPVTRFAHTRHAVEVFGVPAVFTNGFMDDRFLKDYPLDVQRGLQQLFELGRTMPRVRWIEEGTSG
jgi:hypothetical protein